MDRLVRLLRFAVRSLAIYLCVALSGCGGNAVSIWSAESTSPNGEWVAYAHTLQSSGFGTDAVGTAVDLRRAHGSRESIHVLGLSYDSAYPQGVTSVRLTWVDDSHLDVEYGKTAKLNFQAVTTGEVRVTAHRKPTD
jgi:hypothetical protein